jgi:hypothetical protein
MNTRVSVAMVITAALALFVVGTAWDVQWHRAIGRDRLLTAPHVLMLVAIALTGLASLSGLVLHRRVEHGIVLSGLGALLAAVAFPLDDYWHALYGIDVTLWAPFHVMIATGMGMAGVGATVQFMDLKGRRPLLRDVGCAAALAIALATYLVLIAEAAGVHGVAHVAGSTLALYPVLLSFALPVAVVCVALVTTRVGMALVVAAVFAAFRQALFWFVPWATATFATAEGLSFRPSAPSWSITPNAFPGLSLVLVALLADMSLWWGLRRPMGPTRPVLLAVMLAASPASFVDRPWERLLPLYYPQADLFAVGAAAVLWTVAGAALGTVVGLGLAITLRPAVRATLTQLGRARPGLARVASMLITTAAVVLAACGSASAHDAAPLASTTTRLGPYPVEVRYYSEPVGGRALSFEIEPLGEGPEPTAYQVSAVPGPSTDAVPVRARTTPAEGHAGVMGLVNLPVSGKWLLSVEVDGPLGPGGGEAPVVAAPPATAMPEWLAWLIGLTPVWGTLAFFALRVSAAVYPLGRARRPVL